MRFLFNVEIELFTDLDAMGDKSKKSISGGVAKHSSQILDKVKFDSIESMKRWLKSTYGEPYDGYGNQVYFYDPCRDNASHSHIIAHFYKSEIVDLNSDEIYGGMNE